MSAAPAPTQESRRVRSGDRIVILPPGSKSQVWIGAAKATR